MTESYIFPKSALDYVLYSKKYTVKYQNNPHTEKKPNYFSMLKLINEYMAHFKVWLIYRGILQ